MKINNLSKFTWYTAAYNFENNKIEKYDMPINASQELEDIYLIIFNKPYINITNDEYWLTYKTINIIDNTYVKKYFKKKYIKNTKRYYIQYHSKDEGVYDDNILN
jgi:hypothetical protein